MLTVRVSHGGGRSKLRAAEEVYAGLRVIGYLGTGEPYFKIVLYAFRLVNCNTLHFYA